MSGFESHVSTATFVELLWLQIILEKQGNNETAVRMKGANVCQVLSMSLVDCTSCQRSPRLPHSDVHIPGVRKGEGQCN